MHLIVSNGTHKNKITEAQTNMLSYTSKKMQSQWNQWKTKSTVKLQEFIYDIET